MTELTKEMQAFLDAVDAGYKMPDVVPCAGATIRLASGTSEKRYKMCAVIAAYAYKTKHPLDRVLAMDEELSTTDIAQVFHIPVAFLYGFARGFDGLKFSFVLIASLEARRLGYECGCEKRKQYIIKAT
jgi:hypothetical protein